MSNLLRQLAPDFLSPLPTEVAVKKLNDEIFLQASILSSKDKSEPDVAFRVPRKVRSSLADISLDQVVVPSGYELRGTSSQFFLVRSQPIEPGSL